jgi:LL-diaminopimelate aminotransferase
MARKNINYQKLHNNYLFSEIAQKVRIFILKNPGVEIFQLGIGNTTEALPKTIIKGLRTAVKNLSNKKNYTGYGEEQGDKRLREALVTWYRKRGITRSLDEIFISDGAKSDTANIASIFDDKSIIAVQNPAYPVYVDSNILGGKKIIYLPATEKNGLFPKPPTKHADLLYLCSPNNPTGVVATKENLMEFVSYAQKQKAVIIFDVAYEAYIQDENIPHSIYEVTGASTCAIEIGSFSKYAGFTGVRLGWTVIPKEMVIEDTQKGELTTMWKRHQTTMFNGASNIAQFGGINALSKEGKKECQAIIFYYMQNAHFIARTLQNKGFEVFGGRNAPYVWVKHPITYPHGIFLIYYLKKHM